MRRPPSGYYRAAELAGATRPDIYIWVLLRRLRQPSSKGEIIPLQAARPVAASSVVVATLPAQKPASSFKEDGMQLRIRGKLFAAVLVAVVALFVTAGTAGAAIPLTQTQPF